MQEGRLRTLTCRKGNNASRYFTIRVQCIGCKKVIIHIRCIHRAFDSISIYVICSREMLEFIDDIKLNMPKNNIFVSLVLPKIDSSWLDGINCLNMQIVDASRRRGFNVIQHPYFACRGHINEALLAGNRIHLSRLGIKQLGVDIKYSLRSHRNS